MSGNKLASESRTVTPFNRISLRSFGDMTIIQGEPAALVVEAEPDLLPKIKTQVKGDKLIIELGRDWLERLTVGLFNWNRDIRYTVTMSEVHALEIAGAGRITAQDIETQRLKLSATGAASIKIGRLTAQNLDVAVSGRAEFDLAGTVVKQEIDISGSSEYRAVDLISESAQVAITGQGNAFVNTSKELDVGISGMGTVRYLGSPQINQRISGMGSVKRLESQG